MDTDSTLSGRIDAAFGPLLMAKDILDQVMPNSDDGESLARADAFAAELIALAVARLTGTLTDGDRDNVFDFGARSSLTC
ncbi:MAG: hypothetical protein RIQ99_510 [Pseudomonadota bacterium]|jgi:hypothetical protein